MSVMHEEVHQGTRQQQQKGQRAKYMRAMLREQQHETERKKAYHHDARARRQEILFPSMCRSLPFHDHVSMNIELVKNC